MADDFMDAFEDDLEALQELEDEIHDEGVSKSRRSLHFSTPSTKSAKSRIASLNGSTLESASPSQSQPQPLSQASSLDDSACLQPLQLSMSDDDQDEAATEKTTENRRRSQKRRQDDLDAPMSDSEDELVIDAPLPDIAPKAKRQKISEKTVTAADWGDDFEITPPPSPDCTQRRQTQDKLFTELDRMKRRVDQLRKGETPDRVLTRIPHGNFVSATGSLEGTRVYLKVLDEESVTKLDDKYLGSAALSLLNAPLDVLKANIEEEKRRKVIEESQKLSNIVNRNFDDEHEVSEEVCEVEDGQDKENERPASLWVERYAPARYTDLISDESTNRQLLKWLKLWDALVFDKEKRPKKEKKEPKKQEKKFKDKHEVSDELDEHKRPLQKIALLHGPPGLGKTTLAHIIASHAGYNVVEINASDDRSAETFKTKIEAATQMKAVMGADPRPNCLIIDEIDGSPLPAINQLISMVKAGEAGAPEKKKKKKPSLLLRPIICICNDLYVPSLRQLRQLAMVISFPPTYPTTLASRLLEGSLESPLWLALGHLLPVFVVGAPKKDLDIFSQFFCMPRVETKQVTRREKLKADLTALLALCEKADNDIRSCLNTLQFVKMRSRELSLHTVHSLSLGQKDAHKSLFTVWQFIFQMPKPKRKRWVNPYDRDGSHNEVEDLSAIISQNNTAPAARFSNVLDMAQATGESEKVVLGLFENYLEAKVKDPRMEAIQVAGDWLCFTDILQQQILHQQNYSLMRYLPYLPVVFHLLFAVNHPAKIQYPHSQYEVNSKLNKSKNLVTSMLNDVAPVVRKDLNLNLTVTEILPPLLEIIQPSLRPVNTQLYSQREKAELGQLIRIMIAYNMTFHQERSQEGTYNYVLEPCLDEVVRYPGMKAPRQMTYAAKQLIAREIDLEKMRRRESAQGTFETARAPISVLATPKGRKKDKSAVADTTPKNRKNDENDGAEEGGPSPLPNHLRQTLTPKALNIKDADKEVVDFFGRPVSKSVQKMKQEKIEKNKELIGGDIWFCFKEGYTNAVRKTIRLQDLF